MREPAAKDSLMLSLPFLHYYHYLIRRNERGTLTDHFNRPRRICSASVFVKGKLFTHSFTNLTLLFTGFLHLAGSMRIGRLSCKKLFSQTLTSWLKIAYSISGSQLQFFSCLSSFHSNCSHRQGAGERSNVYGIPTPEKRSTVASRPSHHSLYCHVVHTVLQPCRPDVHRHTLPVLVFIALGYPHRHSDGYDLFPGSLKPVRTCNGPTVQQSILLCGMYHACLSVQLMSRGRRIHV